MNLRDIAFLLLGAAALLSCSDLRRSSLPEAYVKAETLATCKPDSALRVLEGIDTTGMGKYERKTYLILKTFAAYNSYAPTISQADLKECTDYFLAGHDRQRRALSHYLIAVVENDYLHGSKARVTDELKRGCREVEGTGDHNLASLLFLRYGVEMYGRKWYDKAIEALEKSFREAEAGDFRVTQVTALINIAQSWLFKGDADRNYDKAIDYALQAVDTADKYGLRDSYAKAMSSLSSCYSRAGDFDNALDCARKATAMQEELLRCGIRKDAVRHVALADAYRKVGNADSALFYAAMDTASTMNPITRASATQLFYIVYNELLHESDSAMKYITSYNRQKESLLQAQENDKVVNNEVAMEQDESRERVRGILAVTLSVIIALLVVALMVFFTMRRLLRRKESSLGEQSRQIERQSEEIREKSEEIERKSEEIERKSEEIERKSAVIEEKTERLHEVLLEKDELIAGLRAMPRYLTDAEGEAIVRAVDRACDGYCTNLTKSHPELTAANLRMLALVRLGFTTGQIAVMEGISPSSVTKAKQRLKSKVGDK